MKEFTTDNFN